MALNPPLVSFALALRMRMHETKQKPLQVLGLRVGTTNTTTAVATADGLSRALLFDGGNVLPSVVAHHAGRWLVGSPAQALYFQGCADVASGFWRDIDTPLELCGDRFMPSQLVAMLVSEARRQAELQVGEPIHNCFVSVPAHFTERHKNALRDSIPQDMELLGVGSDPVCALVACDLAEKETDIALVTRMGGKSLDVGLVTNSDGCKQVLSIGGDQNLGGADLAHALAEWYASTLSSSTEQRQIRNDAHAWASLLEMADRAKHALSVQEDVLIGSVALGNGQLTEPKRVTRSAFEAMCEGVSQRFQEVVENTLREAETRIGLSARDVGTVLFHGGSSNAPFLRRRLEKITGVGVHHTPSPATACARGAALLGQHGTYEDPNDNIHCCLVVIDEQIEIGSTDGRSILVFELGTSLPVARQVEMHVNRATDEIQIPVFKGQKHLGDLVAHFPASIEPGCTVLLEMRLDTNGAVGGRVSVPHMQWVTEATLVGKGETTGKVGRLPPGALDAVHFTITAPPVMSPAKDYELDFWAHLERQRTEVMARAKEQSLGGEIRARSVGPTKISRGSLLTVAVKIRELSVNPPSAHISWEGEIGSAAFLVRVPQDAKCGTRAGAAIVYMDGLRVATVTFAVRVEMAEHEARQLPSVEKHIRRAFASYASKDRDSVLARVQGIQKGAPSLDIFLDVAKLRSGQHWQSVLREEICSRDILYLFWSEAASRSKWVDWEWHCALKHHGIEGIDPVPLVSPDVVPPPQELACHLHFNDWILACMVAGGIERMRQQEDALDEE